MNELPRAPTRTTGLRGRVGLAVLGNGVASLSNLVMTALAARELTVVGFGAFGVVFALYVVTIGAARSLIGEPALVRAVDDRGAARDVYASGLLFAVLSGALVAGAGAALGGPTGSALLAFAVVIPGIVFLDLGRHLAFAALLPGQALLLDLTWAVLQVGGILVLITVAKASAAEIVLVWGGAGAVGGLLALRLSQCRLAPPSMRWIRDSWRFSWRYLVGFGATAGVVQVTTLVLGSIVGVAAVGSVRGAQILLGPLIPIYAGVSAALVPEGARADSQDARFRGHLIRISVLMAIAGAVLTLAGLLIPEEVGRELLGATWKSARGILLPAGVAAIFNGAAAGALIGLRSARSVKTTLSAQLRLAPVQMLLPVAGAFWWDTAGFMWATAGAAFVAGVVWWRAALRPLGSLP